MENKEFHLYRIKFIKPSQLPLLLPDRSSSKLFVSAINDKPELRTSKNVEWHVGNVEFIDEGYGSFAVGKTTRRTVEKFDEETGDFIDIMDDPAPYTQVLFNCKLGILGIAKKSSLAPTPQNIAKKIKLLFQRSITIMEYGVDVRVDLIPDPQDFLQKLRGAYAIRKFKASFTGPNPIDADEIFQKPLSVYAQEIGADNGVIEVNGASLDEEVAESISKATAATGNTASAKIIEEKNGKTKPIYLKGNAVVMVIETEASLHEIIERMNNLYLEVRE